MSDLNQLNKDIAVVEGRLEIWESQLARLIDGQDELKRGISEIQKEMVNLQQGYKTANTFRKGALTALSILLSSNAYLLLHILGWK